LRQEKNGAERQKPGDRQRHDDATKESSHVQILREAEGESELKKNIAIIKDKN